MIDFSLMAVGDKLPMLDNGRKRWGDDQRAVMDSATAYSKSSGGLPQFQTSGCESDGYSIERIR